MIHDSDDRHEHEAHEAKEQKPRTITLQVQTPRGLWSKSEPPQAAKRPVYSVTTHVQTVIDDAREVFNFIENENKYSLMLGKETLKPERTLESYHLAENTLLVLTVKGGNA